MIAYKNDPTDFKSENVIEVCWSANVEILFYFFVLVVWSISF